MQVNRHVVTLLLTVAMAVAPLQGSMANDNEMPEVHAEQSPLSDALPTCAHHDHRTDSDIVDTSLNPVDDQATQAVSSKPACSCSDMCNCGCCNKVLAPVLPSTYSTVWVSTQTERTRTFLLFSSTFVPVRTRPPTFEYST